MIIIGCDFHSRSQQIALLDTATGGADREAVRARERRGEKILRRVEGAGAGGD